MSFFKELKEDLMQAVNELSDEALDADSESKEEDGLGASSDSNTSKLDEQSSDPLKAEKNITLPDREKDLLESFSGTELFSEEPEVTDEMEAIKETDINSETETDSETEPIMELEEDQEEDVQEKWKDEWNRKMDESELKKIEKELEVKDMDMEMERADNFTMEEQVAEQEDTKLLDPAEVTLITKGTTIRGGITSDNSLEVLGTINGDVECQGKLTIIGTVKGNSIASEIFVNTPRLEGDLNSHGSVKIGVGTVVVGDIVGTSAVIAGAVKGNIDVNGPVIIDSTAIVLGDLKAKSLQLNNGAVLEGSCSLGYADIDLESFFNGDAE